MKLRQRRRKYSVWTHIVRQTYIHSDPNKKSTVFSQASKSRLFFGPLKSSEFLDFHSQGNEWVIEEEWLFQTKRQFRIEVMLIPFSYTPYENPIDTQ